MKRAYAGAVEALDTFAHHLHIHCGWLCDLYDLSLGITREELRRKAPREEQ
jgi:hypothetical protein